MDAYTLYAAAIAGAADAIAKLATEADIVDKDNQETILHTESRKGNTEHVRFILREFASKNLLVKLSKCKHTALHLAVYNGRTEVAKILIDAARHLPVTSFEAFLRQGDWGMETALHAAVINGNVAIVKLLVEADPTDTHIQNNEGKTPMYIAVEKGFDDIVEIISTTCIAPSLEGPHGGGAVRINNLDQADSPGGTLFEIMDRYALCVAAIAGDVDAIAKLETQAGILNGGQEIILHDETQNIHAERLRFILKEFAKRKKDRLTPLNSEQNALHLAAVYGHTEVAEILIDAARHLPPSDNKNTHDIPVTSFQAFLWQPDEDLNTPLHIAVMKGHTSIVKLLVEADPSDRHIPNDKGKTPMYIAVEEGYNDIVGIISTTCTAPSLDGPHGSTVMRIKNLDQAKSHGGTLYKTMDKDALYAAAIAGDGDAIAALGMQADKLREDEKTILHTESKNGNTEHVRFILREFASKNLLVKLSKYKHTALHLAVYNGRTEVAKILIDAARHLPVTSFQAFFRQGDKDMDTALHAAVMERNVAIVKLLVKADPSGTHIQNDEGKTPIYLAAERGYYDIMKMICTTCTAPPKLDGPGGSTVLHAAIKNLYQGRKEDRYVIRLLIEAVKHANNHGDVDERDERLIQFFNKPDEKRCIILELAVEGNYLDVVEFILTENPAYNFPRGHYKYSDFIGIKPLIYKAKDKGYNDMANLLTETYQRGVQNVSTFSKIAEMHNLINAIGIRHTDSVFKMLNQVCAKDLVTFADNLGWTALHHATYYQCDSIIGKIVDAQKAFGHPFVYHELISTPFHVAAEKGYTSTMKLLLELWPSTSSAYTTVDKNGQNILHLAALQSKEEMIQWILEKCSEDCKNKIVNEQDNNGNTPLHLLISRGCFIPEFLRYEGLDIWVQNKKGLTSRNMFYLEDEIINDQVQIKLALQGIQNGLKQRTFSTTRVLSNKREAKDAIFHKQAELMILEKHAQIKEDTDRTARCFADAIAGDPISKDALEMEADTLNQEGKNILHIESAKGDTERVRFIVMEFANKNLLGKLDRSEKTALHLAVLHGHNEVVKVLINAARHNWPPSSANPVSSFQDFIRQANGQNTALHLAVLKNNVEIVKLLVEADPNGSHVLNNEGKTPIYVAAQRGYKDIVKEICTTCTDLSLDGPGSRTTALHALIKKIGQGATNVIGMMINAAKLWSTTDFEALFSRTDESGRTVLQLAMERNCVDAVKLILFEDPAFQHRGEIKRSSLRHLIYKAIDNKYSVDIIELLCINYNVGINPEHKDVLALILAIKRRDEESVLGHLKYAKKLVSFKEDNGWTPLHYAVYHEFDSILGAIIEAQEDVGHQFVYQNMVSTPFHVAVEHGYTSTLIRLMQSWPAPSSAVTAADSPYTVVNEIGQNVLHLAAAGNKEMVQGIWKYCPEMYKEKILKQRDNNGDTPLHLLISHGCFIPELIKHKILDTVARNKNDYTPQDMLYFKSDVVADQVDIKIALDQLQTNQSTRNLWAKSTVTPSKRRIKDVILDEHIDERRKLLMLAKREQMKRDLEKYKTRTNTQIIVTALITTVAFTAGFTMPGDLRQSGEADEGLVLLSKKKAFDAFIISDALALLLSTSSLFLYFLESMNDDIREVSKLNTASAVLNIVSVVAMMLTFMAGTYVVLSHSPAIAITVCVIGSLFFVLIVSLSIRAVFARKVKRNED